jgi:hypothetical protein
MKLFVVMLAGTIMTWADSRAAARAWIVWNLPLGLRDAASVEEVRSECP